MSKLLIPNDYPIIASPQLIKLVGMAGAAFIQKLHYCLKDTKVKKYQHGQKTWWKHSLENWLSALGVFSVATIKRAISRLKELGLIEVSQLANNPWDRTNYYTINYAKIKKLFANKPTATPPTKSQKQPLTPPAVPENLAGTAKPINPIAAPDQLNRMPVDIRRLYQQLRLQRLDISPIDPRLAEWLPIQKELLHHIAYVSQHSSTRYGWHTPEQLGLVGSTAP